jgi:hypothetical protein
MAFRRHRINWVATYIEAEVGVDYYRRWQTISECFRSNQVLARREGPGFVNMWEECMRQESVSSSQSGARERGFPESMVNEQSAQTTTTTHGSTTMTPLAEVIHDYIKRRAKVEGVDFGLNVAFFEGVLDSGVTLIFGVEHDGKRILRDYQEPYPGFLASYLEAISPGYRERSPRG